MATVIWRGTAPAVQGVKKATPANVAIGNTFTITFAGGRVFTFTATAATVANVTAGLVALLQASGDPLIQTMTFEDATTFVQVTGQPDGEDFDFTSSASGGTATLTKATITAPSGPNWWTTAANWAGGSVPTDADTAVAESDVPILYGLVTGISENAANLIVGGRQVIGLPQFDPRGFSNVGYRATFLEASFSTVTIRTTGGRCKVDTKAAASIARVFQTGSPLDQNERACEIRGSDLSIDIAGGSVGIGAIRDTSATGSTSATVSTLRVTNGPDSQAEVTIGPIAAVTTLNMAGGTVVCEKNLTTVNKSAGDLTIQGTATVGTLNNDGGRVWYDSSGTITLYRGGTRQVVEPTQAAIPSRIDFSRDHRAVTVTNATLGPEETELLDPGKRVTLTNSPTVNRATAGGIKVVKLAG